jgi:ubiquinone/menaquinone biosynthesis C-methylase UbiE
MNEQKLHDFMGQLVTDMSGAAMIASVIVGEELGLYRAMRDGAAITSDELARRTDCNPRLVREWLSANAAAGYVELVDGKFRLPEEHALALADEDSPVFIAGGAVVVAALYLDKDKVVKAMRGDGALAWGDHHACMFRGTERFFRPGYRANLVSTWLPALDGVVSKLERGAKIADVGCGHGASSVILAQAYPKSRVDGFDYHAESIATAKERAKEAKVEERVSFTTASAKSYQGKDYDLICFFDCLHDMGDPVGAARHAFQALKDDGSVLLVEPFANDSLEKNVGPVARMFYAASTFVCTPSSLSQEGGAGLGAQAGEASLRKVFEEAGFKHFRRATETPFNLVLEARK